MVHKCVHKGCGKNFDDFEEDCVYHPGPPIFHEGQKGWKCCKPRVLTFDEFLSIQSCTTGKHSTVDDTLKEDPHPHQQEPRPPPGPKPIAIGDKALTPRPVAVPVKTSPTATPELPEDSGSDDTSIPVAPNTTCRRRGCNATSTDEIFNARDQEECVYHPGQALFHEGSKGWTCCKRRVLEFDEFMKIEGCKKKNRHLFVGSKKDPSKGEKVLGVRHDFYQTPTTVIASLFLKKIDKKTSQIKFTSSSTVTLDLRTADNKRHDDEIPLYGSIDPAESRFKIMGTKLELTLAKSDGASWATFRSDEQRPNEIIQVGRAGRA